MKQFFVFFEFIDRFDTHQELNENLFSLPNCRIYHYSLTQNCLFFSLLFNLFVQDINPLFLSNSDIWSLVSLALSPAFEAKSKPEEA